jgi:hypothetical protein
MDFSTVATDWQESGVPSLPGFMPGKFSGLPIDPTLGFQGISEAFCPPAHHLHSPVIKRKSLRFAHRLQPYVFWSSIRPVTYCTRIDTVPIPEFLG